MGRLENERAIKAYQNSFNLSVQKYLIESVSEKKVKKQISYIRLSWIIFFSILLIIISFWIAAIFL